MEEERRKDYSDILQRLARIEENQLSAKEALRVSKEIVESQARVMEKRLETMNEFREQLKDQATTFITRREHDILLSDIQNLKETRAMLEGKASQMSVNIAIVFSLIGMVISIVRLFK
jgi:predicted  nucleic acid-binding Zn-ribbon protein